MLTTHSNHPFHLVDYSPWPLTGAIGAMVLVSGLAKWFHLFNINLFMIGFGITLLTMIQWWRDVVREGTYQGLHTGFVSIGLRLDYGCHTGGVYFGHDLYCENSLVVSSYYFFYLGFVTDVTCNCCVPIFAFRDCQCQFPILVTVPEKLQCPLCYVLPK